MYIISLLYKRVFESIGSSNNYQGSPHKSYFLPFFFRNTCRRAVLRDYSVNVKVECEKSNFRISIKYIKITLISEWMMELCILQFFTWGIRIIKEILTNQLAMIFYLVAMKVDKIIIWIWHCKILITSNKRVILYWYPAYTSVKVAPHTAAVAVAVAVAAKCVRTQFYRHRCCVWRP